MGRSRSSSPSWYSSATAEVVASTLVQLSARARPNPRGRPQRRRGPRHVEARVERHGRHAHARKRRGHAVGEVAELSGARTRSARRHSSAARARAHRLMEEDAALIRHQRHAAREGSVRNGVGEHPLRAAAAAAPLFGAASARACRPRTSTGRQSTSAARCGTKRASSLLSSTNAPATTAAASAARQATTPPPAIAPTPVTALGCPRAASLAHSRTALLTSHQPHPHTSTHTSTRTQTVTPRALSHTHARAHKLSIFYEHVDAA